MIKNAPPDHSGGTLVRIGLDCRLAGSRHAGIGRYILNLAQRLPLQSSNFTFVYFINDISQKEEIDPKDSLPVEWKVTPFKHYSVDEQLHFPKVISQSKVSLLHVPHFNVPLLYNGKLIVTVHDLLWHEYKGTQVTTLPIWQYWIKYLMYRLTVSITVKKAGTILVPSKTVKSVLERYYSQVTDKTKVTYEGYSQTLSVTKVSKVNENQILYIGSLYPHKNIELVLRAVQQLPEIQLILVGARDAFSERVKKKIKELGIEKQVALRGYVPDEELGNLIASSNAVIQPSLSEGFGLTGLEAMGSGGVVIASNIPIFKEIYGDAALYFDPYDPKSFIETLSKITPQARKDLQEKGQTQLKKYSWDIMTQQTLDAYSHGI